MKTLQNIATQAITEAKANHLEYQYDINTADWKKVKSYFIDNVDCEFVDEKSGDVTITIKDEVILRYSEDEMTVYTSVPKADLFWTIKKMGGDRLSKHITESLDLTCGYPINEASLGGLRKMLQDLSQGDLIDVVTALVTTKDFAKATAAREVINQLNKRGIVGDKTAGTVDTVLKWAPLAKKGINFLFSEED